MSKNKSAKKKTAEEKQREFSDVVEKKSKQIENTEKKCREFSKAVDEKSKEIANTEEKRQKFKKTIEEKNKEITAESKKDKTEKQQMQTKKNSKASDKKEDNASVAGKQSDIVKASLCTAAVVKYVLIIAIVGGVSIAGLVMCVLNIMRSNWFFAVDYLIAALLGISIVTVKVNTLFPTFVACDDKKVIMRLYENRVVPYNISHKVAFLCDFIPAKTKTVCLDTRKITAIIIGTKNYIKRHCGDNGKFLEEIETIEKSNIGKNTLLGMDMIYIACGNEYEFMSIDRFDTENIAAVVRKCIKINPGAEVLCNNKLLRNKILFDLPSK